MPTATTLGRIEMQGGRVVAQRVKATCWWTELQPVHRWGGFMKVESGEDPDSLPLAEVLEFVFDSDDRSQLVKEIREGGLPHFDGTGPCALAGNDR